MVVPSQAHPGLNASHMAWASLTHVPFALHASDSRYAQPSPVGQSESLVHVVGGATTPLSLHAPVWASGFET
jgi:hypothetical protein